MISRIEVQFAIPVELTEAERESIFRIVNNAARRSQTPGLVHWAAEVGSKPLWREPLEPEWDDSVFCINCCARQRYKTEPYVPFDDIRTKLLAETEFLGRKDGGNISEADMKNAIIRICRNTPEGASLESNL
jgi:hypothetical protein